MFELKGNIIKGIGLGSKLGFPTLNIDNEELIDNYGVFICEVKLNEHIYKGVVHYGPKSIGTDNPDKIYCEIHLLNFNQNIDSGRVYIKVLKKIRDVREFKSKDELFAQISKDIDISKKYFKDV